MSLVLMVVAVLWGFCLLAVLAIWAWSSTGGRADLDIGPEAAQASSSAPVVPM